MTKHMTEQWKKIEGHPQYSVSNLGRTGSENCIHAYRVLKRKKFYGADNATSKKVIRVEDGKVYNSLKEAAIDCGMSSHSHISGVLSGKRKTAGGYHWIYADD